MERRTMVTALALALALVACGDEGAALRGRVERAAGSSTDDRTALNAVGRLLWPRDERFEWTVEGNARGSHREVRLTAVARSARGYPSDITRDAKWALALGAWRMMRAMGDRAPQRIKLRARVYLDHDSFGETADMLLAHIDAEALRAMDEYASLDPYAASPDEPGAASTRFTYRIMEEALVVEEDHQDEFEVRAR